MLPNVWQNFAEIASRTSEMSRWKKRKIKCCKTYGLPDYRSGRPKKQKTGTNDESKRKGKQKMANSGWTPVIISVSTQGNLLLASETVYSAFVRFKYSGVAASARPMFALPIILTTNCTDKCHRRTSCLIIIMILTTKSVYQVISDTFNLIPNLCSTNWVTWLIKKPDFETYSASDSFIEYI